MSPPLGAGVIGVGSHMCAVDLNSSSCLRANIINHQAISIDLSYVLLNVFSTKIEIAFLLVS